ncbi:phosphoribosylanthranilate isomerase [Mesoflavibacter profundi]|uniref:N-(5'-phosphoribosyl)anthranilate isomerase n=1 Tax=Mesoflavibacter profundi TaxID=2708110 RepID=A0ABT4RZH8_9FLAO|nr:phosphoribosylanthranilate isomerase [Mesoflavibacter profundi]MDA0177218.1 phosphoribosylanthranilate isomerase [Mesoflavibacter profundi]
MKIKICGMKYQDNINQVAALQPDYLGFIFYEKSSRFFEGVIPKLAKTIKKVGVFVDASLDFVLNQIKTHQLNVIQLHGKETPEFCNELRQAVLDSASHTVEIIKVFSIKDHFDFSVLQPFENICDYFLFDTKGKLPGGNGYTFNWDVLKNYPSTTPYFLSGGIGLDEVETILSFLQKKESKYCYAIDVNSKFEITPGLKDIEALEKFKEKLIS